MAQLTELKGKVTHFLGDVLTCLIPKKVDTPPSNYEKATIIKEKAWKHLELSIRIPDIRGELRQKSAQKQTT